jgi:carboxyl-terminal processing protease
MTQTHWTRTLGGLLAILALLAPLRALADEPAPRAFVVLVGIDKYKDSQIKPRAHAEADARAVYGLLTDKARQGSKEVQGRLLLGNPEGKAQPATHKNILDALGWIAKEAREHDEVVFGFFGQGGPVGKSGARRVYFAADSTFKDRSKNAVAAEEIAEALKPLKSKNVAFFIDINFKGFKADDKSIAEPTLGRFPYPELLGDEEKDQDHLGKPGRVVFLATDGLNPSLDLKDHGVFAQAVLAGLKGAADKEGYEPDGLVTVDEMKEYLKDQVGELARKHGKTREEKSQINFNLSTRASDFVLLATPEAHAKSEQRLKALAKMAKAGTLSKEFVAEGKKLLERMPRLEYQRKLRKEYQKLVDGTVTAAKFGELRQAILDSTKLKRAEAKEFADRVLKAAQLIQDGYVKPVDPGELVGWSVEGLYEYAREKVPPKIQERLDKVKDLGEADLGTLLADARQDLGVREDLDDQKDLNVALQRMTSHLDPYTTYIDEEMLKRFGQEIDGSFRGIGIQIRKDAATDYLLVVSPIKGSPAYRAKLQEGDLISQIKREEDSKGKPLDKPEIISTKGLSLNDAVKKILGLPGTKVTLTVHREGVEKPFDVTITRGEVELESVLGAKRKANDEWDYVIDPVRKIGYIRLTSFARNSYRDLRKVVRDLERAGMKGFILDLRFNPGGLLDSAIEISDLFVDDGVIVSIRQRARREARFRGEHAGSLLDFPMVCLVNGGSASGSEIVSACLQDHRRALIVGERSYGKGSVQNILDYQKGKIKLTTATFWRPSGKNLNKSSTKGKEEEDWGVIPDKVVKLSRKEREELAEHQHDLEVIHRPGKDPKKSSFTDKQLELALEYLRGQIKLASRTGG